MSATAKPGLVGRGARSLKAKVARSPAAGGNQKRASAAPGMKNVVAQRRKIVNVAELRAFDLIRRLFHAVTIALSFDQIFQSFERFSPFRVLDFRRFTGGTCDSRTCRTFAGGRP